MSERRVTFIFDYTCCERVEYIQNLLNQARNLGLQTSFIQLLENILVNMIPYIKANDMPTVISIYDTNYDNIINARDEAFNILMGEIKNSLTPYPKTVVLPE